MTPRERLASLRAELSRVLRRTLDRHDVSQAALAHGCGSTPQKVQLWCDHERTEGPSVAHLALMPRAVVADLLDAALAPHGLHLAEHVAQPEGQLDHLAQLHRLLTSGQDVTREFSAAIADGVVTRGERERIRQEAVEARRVLSGLIASLDAEAAAERAIAKAGGRS